MMNWGIKVNRIIKIRYQPGTCFGNRQTLLYHYIYILDGNGRIRIDRNHYNTSAGHLYLIPKNIEYELSCDEDMTVIQIKFSCHPSGDETLNSLVHHVSKLSLQEENIIKGVLGDAVSGKSWFEELINVRVTELMIHLLRRQQERLVPSPEYSCETVSVSNEWSRLQIGDVLEYIERNIGKHIGVSDMAQQFGYSEAYFCTIFKKVFDVSPNKYINQVKVSKAKELMLYSQLNISEIAERLGYEHTHYFSRLFKQITRLSPQHYAKKLNNNIYIDVNTSSHG